MRWAVPPPERQSTQFIETTREESCAGFYTAARYPANDQFIGQFVASIHPAGAVILWGRPCSLCIIDRQDALLFSLLLLLLLLSSFVFLSFFFEFREILLPNRRSHAVPLRSLPLSSIFLYSVDGIVSTWKTVIQSDVSFLDIYWKRLLYYS